MKSNLECLFDIVFVILPFDDQRTLESHSGFRVLAVPFLHAVRYLTLFEFAVFFLNVLTSWVQLASQILLPRSCSLQVANGLFEFLLFLLVGLHERFLDDVAFKLVSIGAAFAHTNFFFLEIVLLTIE